MGTGEAMRILASEEYVYAVLEKKGLLPSTPAAAPVVDAVPVAAEAEGAIDAE